MLQSETEMFDYGFKAGYDDYNSNWSAIYRSDSNGMLLRKPRVPATHAQEWTAVMSKGEGFYARGYIQGFMKAESDKH